MRAAQAGAAFFGLYLLILTPFFWLGVALCFFSMGIFLGRHHHPAEFGPRRPAREIDLTVRRHERRHR